MGVNCYLLADVSGVCAVVDPGGDEPDAYADYILSEAKKRGLEIVQIILTHAHFDHMLSLEKLRELTGAPLAIHEADAPALEDTRISYMDRFGNGEPCAPAERPLLEGDKISLGESELTVMHTPGHTPGSICLVCGDEIITGDTLFKGTIGRHDLYGGHWPTLAKSLERFKSLDDDFTLHPGHGESTTLKAELATNPFLR